MAIEYDQIPGALDIKFVQGDLFSMLATFDLDISMYTFNAQILNKVTRTLVQAITVQPIDLAHGQINFQLTTAQTASIPVGKYIWHCTWTIGSAVLTIFSGNMEIISQ